MDLDWPETEDRKPMREVIPQFWKKANDRWRIVHMHVCIDERVE